MELFVDVTHRSAMGLDLTPGGRIWCMFKTHALKYLFEEPESRRRNEPERPEAVRHREKATVPTPQRHLLSFWD
jgi:hypothetical protein